MPEVVTEELIKEAKQLIFDCYNEMGSNKIGLSFFETIARLNDARFKAAKSMADFVVGKLIVQHSIAKSWYSNQDLWELENKRLYELKRLVTANYLFSK